MQKREERGRIERGLLLAGLGTVLAGVLALMAPTAGWAFPPGSRGTPEIVRPRADGTIADGGVFGDFDGNPDDWDWSFDESGYDGAITITTETTDGSLEHRVVWEYDLGGLGTPAPVMATLTFTLRGAPVYPMEDAVIHVYSYPADLDELPEDFNAGPAELQGVVTVAPYQEPTVFELNVSGVVNEALISGIKTVAFRFQINPETPHDKNQAFIDADDEYPETKPYITIERGLQQLPAVAP